MNAPRPTGPSAAPQEATTSGCPVAHGGQDSLTRLYGFDASTDPQSVYERLREHHGPVAPVLLEGDVHAWLVLGYRENRRVLENPRQFTRDSRIWRDWKEGRIEESSPLIQMVGWRPDCVSQEGEAHRRLRAAVTDNLQATAGRGIRRHVTHFANKQIDAFVSAGRAELVTDYAQSLPMLVLTRLFGLAEGEGRQLAVSCAQVIKGGEEALAHNDRIMKILGELAERKRAEPGSDFTTGLLEHRAGLDEGEVLSHLRLVLIAAHTTTSNLLARVLQLLLTHPSHMAGVVSGRLDISAVVEEVMWNTPPLAVCPGRFATADLELGGQQVKAGDLLVLGLAAGNRDPEVRPDVTTALHGNKAHLAFSGGSHECPGQGVGQAIIETAVDVLIHRLHGLRLAAAAEDLTVTASSWEARLDRLPVEFTAQET
ncbi:cytochrome P450 [Streptomyces aurantiacus]|uniref:Putative Cytochrome n=1 Tax=Streptomyces aurantiacus JA 4570 TaxID=1286094 RepID=S3ZPQ3_9ACTN|nr:cytochrome P450 [Streptomyces aurantiacus]EPH45163.1 putative Cytochrome [Streptomyces aurantiacus JA 4570]